MRTAAIMFVVTIGEQECATEVYQQSNTRDPDRLVKVNFQWNKQTVHRFARHQKSHDREHNRAGEPAEHTNLSGAETEARVACLRTCKVVRHGRYQKCDHMRAHVPAIG